MRSVHVDTGRTWRGGQAQVLYLLGELARVGDDPLLVAPRGCPLDLRAAAARLRSSPCPLRGEWDLLSVLRLGRILRRERADIVHAHTAHALTIAGLAARLATGVRVVAARRVDFPVSVAGRCKLRHLAARVVAVSAEVQSVLVAAGIPGPHIEVIPSGIDLARFPFRVPARSTRPDPLIGSVGALTDHKDQRTLIDAAALVHAHLPGARFAIAGEGRLRATLEAHIAARGLSGVVELVGFCHDVPAFLGRLDAFVLSSHSEGLGTAVLDAMAAGIPVVATRAGGIPEMLEDGVTGLLVPVRDPPLLSAAIERLLADPGLATRLRTAARIRVEEHFSHHTMAAATRRLYLRLLGREP